MKTRIVLLVMIMLIALSPLAWVACMDPMVDQNADYGMMVTYQGHDLHWALEDLPLLVVLDDDLVEWEKDVQTAIEIWNNIAGRKIYVYGKVMDTFDLGNGGAGLLIITTAGPSADPHAVLRWDHKTGEIYGSPIRIPLNVIQKYRLRVMVHEFGHTLGLAHDPGIPWSVMYPDATGDGTGKWSITNGDRETIMKWYNPDKLYEEVNATKTASTSTSTATCHGKCHSIVDLDDGQLIYFPPPQ